MRKNTASVKRESRRQSRKRARAASFRARFGAYLLSGALAAGSLLPALPSQAASNDFSAAVDSAAQSANDAFSESNGDAAQSANNAFSDANASAAQTVSNAFSDANGSSADSSSAQGGSSSAIRPLAAEQPTQLTAVTIRTVEDLRRFARDCSLDSYSRDKAVTLEADLDLDGEEITVPSFSGVFDGQNHTISGLSVKGSVSNAGLFTYVEAGATVKNLRVTGEVLPEGEQSYVGAIAGTNRGLIQNCSFSGTVAATGYVGGIAGTNTESGEIAGCIADGKIEGTRCTGGIAGQNLGVIRRCTNKAAVNTAVREQSASPEALEELFYRKLKSGDAQGEVIAATDTGGIAGYSNGILQSCTNNGEIGYPHVGYNVGGIVGRQSGYLNSCTNNGKVQGRKDVGGIVGQMVPSIDLLFSESSLADLDGKLNNLNEALSAAAQDARDSSAAVTDTIGRAADYLDAARESADTMGDLLHTSVEDAVSTINSLAAAIDGRIDSLAPILGDFRQASGKAGSLFDDMAGVSGSLNDLFRLTGDSVSKLSSLASNLQNAVGEVRGAIDALREAFRIAGQNPPASLQQLEQDVSTLSGQLDALSQTLTKAQEELANGGSVSADTAKTLFSQLTDVMKQTGVVMNDLEKVLADIDWNGLIGGDNSGSGNSGNNENGGAPGQTGNTGDVSGNSAGSNPASGSAPTDNADAAASSSGNTENAAAEKTGETGTEDTDDGKSEPTNTENSGSGKSEAAGSENSGSGKSETDNDITDSTEHSVGVTGADTAESKTTTNSTPNSGKASIGTENGSSASGHSTAKAAQTASAQALAIRAASSPLASAIVTPGMVDTEAAGGTGDGASGETSGGGSSNNSADNSSNPDGNGSSVNSNSDSPNSNGSSDNNSNSGSNGSSDSSGSSDNNGSSGSNSSSDTNNSGSGLLSPEAAAQLQKAAELLRSAGDSFGAASQDFVSFVKSLENAKDVPGEVLAKVDKLGSGAKDSFSSLHAVFGDLADWANGVASESAVSFSTPGAAYTESSDRLNAALSGVLSETKTLSCQLDGANQSLATDIENIGGQIVDIMNLFTDALNEVQSAGDDPLYEDVSDEDIAQATQGKVSDSANYGAVHGDLDVGGIAGNMGIENDLDPEGDLSSIPDDAYRVTMQTKAILLSCDNYGSVTAKKNCAGGVVGRMELGILAGCGGYGRTESTSGDYIGGVGGYALSTIRDSYAKCTLAGRSYLGGIVGSGEKVNDCVSMVQIEKSTQFAGAIAGEITKSAAGNVFVSDTLAGIDRVSYAGQAEPVSYETLLEKEKLPREFAALRLTFRTYNGDDSEDADEENSEIIKTVDFRYGDSFGADVYPQVPQKNGHYVRWDRTDLTNLRFDTIVTGTWPPYVTVLPSEAARDDGRPVFYIEGSFEDGETITTVRQDKDGTGTDTQQSNNGTATAAQTSSDGDTVTNAQQSSNTATDARQNADGDSAFAELWAISCPDDGQTQRAVRFRPAQSGESPTLYLRDETGGWNELSITQEGQYLQFEINGDTAEIAVGRTETPLSSLKRLLPCAAGGAAIVLLAAFQLHRRRRRKHKKGGSSS